MWSEQEPNANVGLSPDENFCFLETDDEAALKAACADLPPEVFDTTRAGANPNRCAYYYRQTMRTRKAGNMTASREGQENLFEFKQQRMIMTGPGSVHKNGNVYKAEWRTIPAMPDVLLKRLCELYGAPTPGNTDVMSEDVKRQADVLDRFLTTYEVPTTGDWFNKGNQWYRPIECLWADVHENESGPDSTCVVYTEGGGYGFDCKHRCSSKGWKEFRAELESRFPGRRFSFNTVLEPVIGSGNVQVADAEKPEGYPRTLRETLEAEAGDGKARRESTIVNWRGLFHTKKDVVNCPTPTYFIQDFLQHEAICGIAAPVGQRKSLIALNVARSLCTGEPLFGFLPVMNKPERVLLLCPEMGLISMSERLRNAGLTEYLDDRLLFRSMNCCGVDLRDVHKDALRDSVLILDTAIRFVEGDENSAKDMRLFSDTLFGLQRLQGPHGAIIILYHSPKTTKDAFELTLENCLRGSGELGASLTDCWGTRMQDPEKGWDSLNFISHVKVRDYAGPKDFEVFCDKATGIMSRVGDPEVVAVLNVRKGGQKANADGMDDAAHAFIKAKPDLTIKALIAGLAEMGIKRKKTWVTDARIAIRGGGSKHGEE